MHYIITQGSVPLPMEHWFVICQNERRGHRFATFEECAEKDANRREDGERTSFKVLSRLCI